MWGLDLSFRAVMLPHKTEEHYEVRRLVRRSCEGGRSPWTTAAFALVLAFGVASIAGAKDLRAVLFNWMWHQGMLKGNDERDMWSRPCRPA
jgi:hypothetical protein